MFFLKKISQYKVFEKVAACIKDFHWWNFCAAVQFGLWSRITPWKFVKIQEVPSLVCGFFCILTSCGSTFLIPIASSVLNQYSMLIEIYHFINSSLWSCFCFEKEVTSFYRNYSLRNSRSCYISVNSMQLHSTWFYMN